MPEAQTIQLNMRPTTPEDAAAIARFRELCQLAGLSPQDALKQVVRRAPLMFADRLDGYPAIEKAALEIGERALARLVKLGRRP